MTIERISIIDRLKLLSTALNQGEQIDEASCFMLSLFSFYCAEYHKTVAVAIEQNPIPKPAKAMLVATADIETKAHALRTMIYSVYHTIKLKQLRNAFKANQFSVLQCVDRQIEELERQERAA